MGEITGADEMPTSAATLDTSSGITLVNPGESGVATVTATLSNGLSKTVHVILARQLIKSDFPGYYFTAMSPGTDMISPESTFTPANRLFIYGPQPKALPLLSVGHAYAEGYFLESGTDMINVPVLETGESATFNIVSSLSGTAVDIYTLDGDVVYKYENGVAFGIPSGYTNNVCYGFTEGAPANGAAANSIYVQTQNISPASMTVELSGGMLFADTRTGGARVFPMEEPFDLAFDVIDTVAENPVSFTLTPEGGSPVTGDTAFDKWPSSQA
ncbi:hypothetical protein ACK2EI_003487 [Salmonella enterica]